MFTFEIAPDNAAPYRVVGTSRDVVVWERTGRNRYLGQLQERPSMTALAELAYFAARRKGLFSGSLEEFMANCDVTPLAEDDEDETRQAQPSGPTSPEASSAPPWL